MRATVFDSYAVLALLFAEPGKELVKQHLHEASLGTRAIAITTINWAEVGYQVLRKKGPVEWAATRDTLLQLPIAIVPVDRALAELAAGYNAAHKLSLADACAAALAHQQKATLVTGDPEFKPLERELKITWLN